MITKRQIAFYAPLSPEGDFILKYLAYFCDQQERNMSWIIRRIIQGSVDALSPEERATVEEHYDNTKSG